MSMTPHDHDADNPPRHVRPIPLHIVDNGPMPRATRDNTPTATMTTTTTATSHGVDNNGHVPRCR